MGFPIYLMAITVSSAGIPVAISIVTAEKVAKNDFKGAERVFHVTLRLLFVTGLVFSLALFFGAQKLIDWQFIRDARAYYSIIALAPAVFFVTFLASFRGYLQGWQIMTPTCCFLLPISCPGVWLQRQAEPVWGRAPARSARCWF